MDEYILRTVGLTKAFKDKIAVNNLSLNIKKGEIYGFVGKNGAGKTTAMKLVLDLQEPDAGVIELFGQTNSPAQRKKIGALIETPVLYPGYTAYDNLKAFSYLYGGDEKQIKDILNFVGLSDTGRKRVSQFSLGMKQRLGIGIALLGRPEFLVLDEPVNGLDPEGIKDVRELILRLNKENGMTIWISSHLLSELEKLATTFGIINNGILIEELTHDELIARCENRTEFVCSDPVKAAFLIKENFDIEAKTSLNSVIIDTSGANPAVISKMLVLNDILVSEIKNTGINFEDYFITRLGDKNA